MDKNLIGRTLRWTNGDKQPASGVVRDSYVVMQQEQNKVSGLVYMQPVWMFLVEVLEPPKYASTLGVVLHNADGVTVDPLA